MKSCSDAHAQGEAVEVPQRGAGVLQAVAGGGVVLNKSPHTFRDDRTMLA